MYVRIVSCTSFVLRHRMGGAPCDRAETPFVWENGLNPVCVFVKCFILLISHDIIGFIWFSIKTTNKSFSVFLLILHPSPSPPPCPPSSSSPLHTHICTQHAHSTSLSMDVFLLFNQAHTIRDIFLNSCLARQAWKPRYPSLKIC